MCAVQLYSLSLRDIIECRLANPQTKLVATYHNFYCSYSLSSLVSGVVTLRRL